jgi:creatinine amidohydrolase
MALVILRLEDLTRERIGELAPHRLAVLPTASIEQHGPHLPVGVDTFLCEAVVASAAQRASNEIVVAPTLRYGDSAHHLPFPGVLTLSSGSYVAAVGELCDSLYRSGFQRLAVINGHGGNDAGNEIATRDLVHGTGSAERAVTVSASAYWEIARAALVAETDLTDSLIPGHAGRFETALMMAVRPELVNEAALAGVGEGGDNSGGRFRAVPGAESRVRAAGGWQQGGGYTDQPALAEAAAGARYFEVITREVAAFLDALATR